ncbi:winged helix-turn-helix domain-containing protein [Microbulbifer harenosus]|uniref:Response regulator transcription factor n=1 Tax=Microbulbifer harenosus TaxID=2576840 RepID=A0ABY2UIC3_9GAMM|nr:response regulator transcription factor [Microbulbifer harenosus]TLM77333.1 response regulator transcription factor [Microbulbifer harenosus]
MHDKQILLLEGKGNPERSPREFLIKQGFSVQQLADGSPLKFTFDTIEYDVVLWNSDAINTEKLEIIRHIRRSFVGPLLIISSQNNTKIQLDAFESGADDFIITPVDSRVLLARIHVCLKRATHLAPKKSIVQIQNLTVNHAERSAKIGGQLLPLSTGEFEILWLLVSHPKRLLSRDFLFVHALGRQYDGLDRAVDRRVSRLRKKLEKRPELSLTVRTVWGQGYILAAI